MRDGICPRCGNILDRDSTFCGRCGAPIKQKSHQGAASAGSAPAYAYPQGQPYGGGFPPQNGAYPPMQGYPPQMSYQPPMGYGQPPMPPRPYQGVYAPPYPPQNGFMPPYAPPMRPRPMQGGFQPPPNPQPFPPQGAYPQTYEGEHPASVLDVSSEEAPPAPDSPYAVLSTMQYLGMCLLMILPIVNIIFLMIWGYGGCTRQNQQNLARAGLIVTGIVVAVNLILAIFLWNSGAQLLTDIVLGTL